MRVAYVCADPGVPVCGRKGASVHVQGVVAALARRGADVRLLAARFDGDLPLGVMRAVALPRPRGEAVRREPAQIAANDLLAAALGDQPPLDLVYERYALFSCAAMEWAAEHGVPSVLEVNAPLIDEQAEHRTLVHRAEAEAATRRALAAARVILAVSPEVARWLERFEEARGRVVVVPNGFDPDRFATLDRPCHVGSFTAGFVGTLKPWHGIDVLVEAFALLRARRPRARLLVVGDGPLAPLLDGLAGVEMTGAVDPRDVPAHMARMDAAVAPYPQAASFYFSPLKVIEAMAAGLPVVCSRVGSLPDLVQPGRTGLLCPPGDARALAAALETLAAEPARARAIGAAARAHALLHHSWDAVVDRVLALALEGVAA